jgi:PTS system mannose-specific IIA component
MSEPSTRIGVVVVTHGQLATELVNSAEMIVGDLAHFAAVSIGWHDDVDHARQEIGRAIERVQGALGGPTAGADGHPPGVLVLSDMFGGTPANLAVTFVSPHVEVITGVNLPMLIKLARPQQVTSLQALARDMREHGRNAIWVASELLKGQNA